MTLDELRRQDSYGAFADFITVSQAKEINLIPEEYHKSFDDNCKCGSEMIIKNTLTEIQCCDPRCSIKLGYALAELFSRFGCKGMGEETCKSIVRQKRSDLKIPSHIELLTMLPDDYPEVLYGAKQFDYVTAKEQIMSRKMSFGEMISLIAIPEFHEDAKKIFSKYNSLREVVEEIKAHKYMQDWFATKGVYSTMKLFYFSTFIRDIALAETIFFDNLRAVGMIKLPIVVTGRLSLDGVRMSEAEFIELCNNVVTLENGTRLLEISSVSAVNSVPFIVADFETTNRKYLIGKERGVLITSKQFIDYLKERVEECKTLLGNTTSE